MISINVKPDGNTNPNFYRNGKNIITQQQSVQDTLYDANHVDQPNQQWAGKSSVKLVDIIDVKNSKFGQVNDSTRNLENLLTNTKFYQENNDDIVNIEDYKFQNFAKAAALMDAELRSNDTIAVGVLGSADDINSQGTD